MTSRRNRWPLILWLGVFVAVVARPAGASAFEVKKAGSLKVPAGAQLFAFSTDPTIQEVLSQDFGVAQRSGNDATAPTVTVSVNVSQQMLKPGISLSDLAPGDPQVADLIRAAGANPPPLGDTGDQFDQAALARRMAARDLMPHDTAAEQMVHDMSKPSGGSSEGFGLFRPPIPLPCSSQAVAAPGCPPAPAAEPSASPGAGSVGDIQQYLGRKRHGGFFGSPDNKNYDTVVVARASISGAPEEMTLVAVSHSGEDVGDAKKQIAEEIANAILH
ncbi:MAG TPA: hypothetical protein VJN94_06770 [Candidatus Binataceae bacterium]|nr:hypothetical protein [Candidatus Binataceae bacterium]